MRGVSLGGQHFSRDLSHEASKPTPTMLLLRQEHGQTSIEYGADICERRLAFPTHGHVFRVDNLFRFGGRALVYAGRSDVLGHAYCGVERSVFVILAALKHAADGSRSQPTHTQPRSASEERNLTLKKAIRIRMLHTKGLPSL